jgi:peptidyl-prolyl cis-trans isomerase SurA
MTLSAPTFRILLAGLAVSVLSVSAISLSAQATSKTANQGPYQPQAQASPFNGAVVEDVVARVNDQIITRSDYQRALQQMDSDGKQQGVSEQELNDRKKTLLRDLIDKELLLSKGKELGITGETELVKRLDEIRKQNHLESMEDLEKAAQQQGVSYEDFKQNIRNEIISQSVIRQEVSRRVNLTKTDVANFYRTHQAEFAQTESVHLASILIPVDGDSAESLAKAQAKAAEVESELKSGASFEDLAKKNSSGPTASTGGDLGDFKRGALPKPLEDASFALKAGEVTEPIRTKQGMLIMKVTQHVGGASQDYASIEPQVEEAAFMSRMQPALRAYLSTLREQSYVDVRPGLVDAGAASNTVKPHIVYSAYVQPGKKKEKKKVVRTRFNETRHTFRNKSGSGDQASTKSLGTPAAPRTAPAAATANTATAAAPVANAATAAAGTQAAAPATPSTSNVAANTPSSKPVKKQKVRFGQAPVGTLDNAPANSSVAAAAPPADTQVASAGTGVSSNITGAGIDENAGTAVKKEKTRFSSRKGKEVKGPTQDQLENKAQGDVAPEQTATEQTQAAPLGLGGDTATKKKPVKVKSDQKTRFTEKPKAASADQNSGATTGDNTAPASSGTPSGTPSGPTPEAGAPATNSAPPAATQDEKAPLDTTPAQPGTTAPAAPSTPQTSPQ